MVSAGGTMNREAVALGTPVWTTFEGSLGAVDERLIAEGRLSQLKDGTGRAEKRDGGASVSGCAAIRRSSPTCWRAPWAKPKSTDEFRRLGRSTRTYAIESPTGDPP